MGSKAEMTETVYSISGHCPICAETRWFRAQYHWYRDHLFCEGCGSVPRERALALVLNQAVPDWRFKRIHECSPVPRGISLQMSRECRSYIGTQFFPGQALGEIYDGYRNENLERTTFADGAFDIVLSLDVMEHVNEPGDCIKDIYRTLAPGGLHIFTAPTYKERVDSERVARFLPDGSEEFYEPPEYHGNPVNAKGALVTFRYGYEFAVDIARYAPFDVQVRRFCDHTHGIIGEFTEVYECYKRETV
jgi:SAM-dependent methyltransferase